MARRMAIVTAVVALVCVAALVAAPAESRPASDTAKVESLVNQALAEYKAGNTGDAVAHLQEAITLMQKSLSKGLAAVFPEAPAGWEAGKVESNAMSFGSADGSQAWTQVSRTYTKTGVDLNVKIEITNTPQLIEAAKATAEAFKNPQMLAALNQNGNTKVEVVGKDGWFGWQTINKGSSAELVAYNKDCLLTVHVNKDDAAAMSTFWNSMNLRAISGAQSTSRPAGK
jgi:hypothetical protein